MSQEQEKSDKDQKDAPQRANLQEIVTFMTTEHFTLQTARSATISDASGRASLYINTVSSTLVALAFIGQVTSLGQAFFVFALILFPTLFFLGFVTFVRVLQTAIEDDTYARGTNRIRHFYQEIAPQMKDYFILTATDDEVGAFASTPIMQPRFQLLFTTAGIIGVINSVIAGVFIGMIVQLTFGLPLVVCVLSGVAAFIVIVGFHFYYQYNQWSKAIQARKVMFPSDQSTKN